MALEQVSDISELLNESEKVDKATTTCGNSLATLPRFQSRGQPNIEMNLDKGSTAVGFIYRGGIILCADSRITQGNVILSKSMLKVMPVGGHIMATVAGRAADCTFWVRTLAWEYQLHEMKYNEPMSVQSAARIISKVAMENHDRGRTLPMGMILAGRDIAGGPSLLRIDSNGFLSPGTAFAVGSGSANALSILGAGFHQNLTDDQAYDLGFRAVYNAALTDPNTGGSLSLHHMAETTWRLVATVDREELHENYSRGRSFAGEETEHVESLSPRRKRLKMGL